MLKKNIAKSSKVAQLSGYVSAETSYHHGETSLQQAIVGMAQNFVGSNNINLLYPDGNHGSRLAGGKDAASARYIFTKLCEITNYIFNSYDAPLLNYLNDDGQKIEPEWFIPVIPMILVNGCEGIGTGYSTFIPPHNPKDIIANILRVLEGKTVLPMKPYFRGFGGEVIDQGNGSYLTYGKWEKISDMQIKIVELPVGTWVTPYKEFLESLVENSGGNSKKDPNAKKRKVNSIILKDVKNQTRDENTGIEFIVEFKNKSDLDKLIKNGTLEKELKLTKTFNTNNMYLFDDNLIPTRYKHSTDILLDFCDIRMDFYVERKKYIIAQLEKELKILQSKVRFIDEYINSKLEINKKTKEYVVKLLDKKGFYKYNDKDESETDKDKDSEEEKLSSNHFDYLIKMPLISLTFERIEGLNKQTIEKERQLNELLGKTEKDLWKEDIQNIAKYL